MSVSKFTYLGSDVDSGGYCDSEIHRRLGIANSVMGQLESVLLIRGGRGKEGREGREEIRGREVKEKRAERDGDNSSLYVPQPWIEIDAYAQIA